MNEEDVSVLILSDDLVSEDEIDAGMLTNLVYVQDIINDKVEADPDFDAGSIDVIAEINDPKHHDVVSSYSVKNVVISNRYISKMITQIGEKEAIFEFYNDILTYDDDEESFDSKEITAGVEALAADVNGDGVVNISDVTTLIEMILHEGPSHIRPNGDINQNGETNISDVTTLIDLIMSE